MRGDFEIHYEIQQQYPKAKHWHAVVLQHYGVKADLPITEDLVGARILWGLEERIKDGTKFRLVEVTRAVVNVVTKHKTAKAAARDCRRA